MRGFPEIEDFVAILDRGKESGNRIRDKEDVERYIQWQVKRSWSDSAWTLAGQKNEVYATMIR